MKAKILLIGVFLTSIFADGQGSKLADFKYYTRATDSFEIIHPKLEAKLTSDQLLQLGLTLSKLKETNHFVRVVVLSWPDRALDNNVRFPNSASISLAEQRLSEIGLSVTQYLPRARVETYNMAENSMGFIRDYGIENYMKGAAAYDSRNFAEKSFVLILQSRHFTTKAVRYPQYASRDQK